MEYLTSLCTILLMGYGGATLIFLFISLFYAPFRRMRDQYLSVSNITAMVIGILVAIGIILKYLDDAMRNVDYTFLPYSIVHIILVILFTGLFPLLFLYGKLKKNIPFRLLTALLMNVACIYKAIFFVIVYYYKDHAPTSWAYYRSSYIEMISWPLGYFLAMLILAKSILCNQTG